MRQLKIVVLSVLVVSDKLEFIGQLMSRRRTEFRARFTGDIPIASGGAASAAKPLVNEKKQSEPRRQEWAAEGVVSIYCIAFCHPDLRRGSGIFWGCTSGYARHADACRAPPLAMGMSPCRALNSSGLQPYKHQFVVESKQYSLIAGAIN